MEHNKPLLSIIEKLYVDNCQERNIELSDEKIEMLEKASDSKTMRISDNQYFFLKMLPTTYEKVCEQKNISVTNQEYGELVNTIRDFQEKERLPEQEIIKKRVLKKKIDYESLKKTISEADGVKTRIIRLLEEYNGGPDVTNRTAYDLYQKTLDIIEVSDQKDPLSDRSRDSWKIRKQLPKGYGRSTALILHKYMDQLGLSEQRFMLEK